MRKGNAAIFLLVVSAISVAVTAYFVQNKINIGRAGAATGNAPSGQIISMPQTARMGESIDIVAEVIDTDKDLATPFSIFSNVIKIYYSKTVSANNPDDWTEIPASQATYQCFTDASADHCKIFAYWTPPSTGKYTFMVNGYDNAGNKCSGNPFFNYAAQTEWKRCGLLNGQNNEDWREVTVSALPAVGGHIRDQNGNGIPNVDVGIYPQGTKEYIVRTTSDGYFSLDTADLPPGRLYSVRANATPPTTYEGPPRSTNVTHSVNTVTNANTPLGSAAYENQKVGQNDCGKVDVSGTGCDFEYIKVGGVTPPVTIMPSASPTPTNTPTQTPTPTKTPTPTQTPTPTPSLTNTPTPSPTLSVTPSVTLTLTPTPSVISGTISPTPTGCQKQKGDANCDGVTSVQDYAIWRQEYLGGCTVGNYTFKACGEDRDGDNRPMDADFNGDGKVTLIDFTIWKNFFK